MYHQPAVPVPAFFSQTPAANQASWPSRPKWTWTIQWRSPWSVLCRKCWPFDFLHKWFEWIADPERHEKELRDETPFMSCSYRHLERLEEFQVTFLLLLREKHRLRIRRGFSMISWRMHYRLEGLASSKMIWLHQAVCSLMKACLFWGWGPNALETWHGKRELSRLVPHSQGDQSRAVGPLLGHQEREKEEKEPVLMQCWRVVLCITAERGRGRPTIPISYRLAIEGELAMWKVDIPLARFSLNFFFWTMLLLHCFSGTTPENKDPNPQTSRTSAARTVLTHGEIEYPWPSVHFKFIQVRLPYFVWTKKNEVS